MSYTQSELNYYKKNPKQITSDLDKALLKELLDHDIQNMKYIKSQTFELIQYAYNKDKSVFKYIDFSKVSIQFLEKAVESSPTLIQYVYSPSPDLIKIALRKDLNILPYVEKYLDEKLYDWLLKQNGLLLEHIPIKKQTEDLIRIALHENIESYKYAYIKTKEFDLYIIEKDPSRIDLISEYWPELIEPLVKYNPRFVTKFFKYPELITQEIKKLVISLEPKMFKILPDPNFELMKYTISLDINNLDYIAYNQDLLDYAISVNGLALKYVRKKDLRTIKNALKQNINALDYIPYPRQFLIDYAFTQDGLALKYITNPTYEQCLDAVKRNAEAIKYIPEIFKSNEIQLIALIGGPEIIPYIGKPADNEVILQILRIDPSYIFKIEDPTEEMYMNAFAAAGRLIMFYPDWNEKFNDDIISTALNHDGAIFEFVKYKSKRLALVAIEQYPPAIQWMDFQDIEIANKAVSLDPRTLFFVDKNIMSASLIEMAIKLDPEYFTRTTGVLTWEEWIKQTDFK